MLNDKQKSDLEDALTEVVTAVMNGIPCTERKPEHITKPKIIKLYQAAYKRAKAEGFSRLQTAGLRIADVWTGRAAPEKSEYTIIFTHNLAPSISFEIPVILENPSNGGGAK